MTTRWPAPAIAPGDETPEPAVAEVEQRIEHGADDDSEGPAPPLPDDDAELES